MAQAKGAPRVSAAVVRGNALRLPLADKSVDLIVTSPPYFALRSYQDGDEHYRGQLGSEETPQAFLEALWAVTAELWRILKPTGSLWVNLGDSYSRGSRNTCDPAGLGNAGLPSRVDITDTVPAKSLRGLPWRYAIGCIDGQAAPQGKRWILRAEVVWSKPNGLPESVTDRVRRSHEQWFHLVRSPRYFAAVDEVREDYAPSTLVRYENPTPTVSGSHPSLNHAPSSYAGTSFDANPLGKLPGSIWSIPSEPLLIPPAVARHYDLPDHFAAFPTEWPRRIILGWSPSGICVECGEGRRPVVANSPEYDAVVDTGRPGRQARWGDAGGSQAGFKWQPTTRNATITGYACACPSLPPTRPAVILDPFGGTGTVAMVARALGRFGVSLDLSADYCRLSKWRIWSSGHGEKAIQRTHKANQGDLFSSPPEAPIEDVVSL